MSDTQELPAQPAEQPARPPGRTKRAAEGAAGGAAGGPAGAAAGAVLGALSGGKHPRGQGRKALVGEFLICLVVTLVGGLSGGGQPGPWMKKAAAIGATYAILSFVSSIGETPRRFANGIGLLVMLAVVIADDKVLGNLLGMIQNAHAPASATAAAGGGGGGGGGGGESLQEQLEPGGDIAAEAGTATHNAIVGGINDLEHALENTPGESVAAKVFHWLGF
jgi:hypothetical protein